MKKILSFSAVMFVFMLFASCEDEEPKTIKEWWELSLDQDKEFGEKVDVAILNDPLSFPLVSKEANSKAYAYVESMLLGIISSDSIQYRDEFNWLVRIIDSPVQNAFAAPGGKIYIYKGMIDFMDNGAQLAGVLAHEVAHIDRRHSMQQMVQAYGLDVILDLLEERGAISYEKIARDKAEHLIELKFSRDDEYEADGYSVKYLSSTNHDTRYHPKGMVGFFEKLNADGYSNNTFEFLKTHPTDANRVENIEMVWESLGKPTGEYYEQEYRLFKILLGL